MKTILTFVFFLQVCISQSQELISTTGNSLSSSSLKISFSLGEIFISKRGVSYTEGLQQSTIEVITGVSDESTSQIKLFPNPASNILTIHPADKKIAYDLTIINANGKQLMQFHQIDGEIQIDLESYTAGVYIFKISTINDIGTYQIIIK